MKRRLTLVAGSGALVPHVVAAAQAAGYEVQVLTVTPRDDLPGVRVRPFDMRNPVSAIAMVRGFRTTHGVFAGGVQISDSVRSGIAKFALGKKAGDAGAAGDIGVSGLGKLVKTIFGAELVGVHEIAPDLITEQGLLAGRPLDERENAAAAFALGIARGIGRLDIGQAAVVSGQRVVGVEDIAGTDSLLARVAAFRAEGLTGDGAWPLVLAKARKPGQPVYVDLPAIGPDTVAACARAGIRVIALESGHSLILERQKLLDDANRAGISVIGMPVPGDTA